MAEIEGRRFSAPFISALQVQESQIYSHVRDRSLNSLLDENMEHCLPGLKFELWKLPRNKSIRILDLGCGEGTACKEFQADYQNWEIHGFDLMPVPKKIFWEKKKGTDQSQKKSIKELVIKYLPEFNVSKTEEFVKGEASVLPYKSNQFNLVYSKYTYSYFPDKTKAIAEALRVTKPGGVVLLQIQPGDAYELVEDQAIAKKLKKKGMLYQDKSLTKDEPVFKKIDILHELQANGINCIYIEARRNNCDGAIRIYKEKGDNKRAILPFKFISATDNFAFTKYHDHIDSFYKRVPLK